MLELSRKGRNAIREDVLELTDRLERLACGELAQMQSLMLAGQRVDDGEEGRPIRPERVAPGERRGDGSSADDASQEAE